MKDAARMSLHRLLSPLVIVGFVCALVLFAGCEPETETPPEDPAITPDEAETQTVIDVLRDDNRFSEFMSALEQADLEQTLQGPGPFTIFAPTNDAFEATGEDLTAAAEDEEQPDRLIEILTYHIASGMVSSEDLAETESLMTLHGSEFTITAENGDVMIDGQASVVDADIQTDNGVIHAIDAVLMPPQFETTDPTMQ